MICVTLQRIPSRIMGGGEFAIAAMEEGAYSLRVSRSEISMSYEAKSSTSHSRISMRSTNWDIGDEGARRVFERRCAGTAGGGRAEDRSGSKIGSRRGSRREKRENTDCGGLAKEMA